MYASPESWGNFARSRIFNKEKVGDRFAPQHTACSDHSKSMPRKGNASPNRVDRRREFSPEDNLGAVAAPVKVDVKASVVVEAGETPADVMVEPAETCTPGVTVIVVV